MKSTQILIVLLFVVLQLPGNLLAVRAKPMAIKDDFRVNDDSGYYYQGNAKIAADEDGNFAVCWLDNRNGNVDVYAQRYDAHGNRRGVNFRVNDDTGDKNQTYPNIAMDSDGNFVIVWLDNRDDTSYIYAQMYNNLGETTGSNFRVDDNDRTMNRRSEPVVAKHADGDFIIAWIEAKSYKYIYGQKFSQDGAPIGGNIQLDRLSTGKSNLSIEIDNNKNYYLCFDWSNNTHAAMVVEKRAWNGGTLFSTCAGDPDLEYNRQSPAMSVNPVTEELVVVWQQTQEDHGSNFDIYAERFDKNGDSIESYFPVSEDVADGQTNPAVSVGDDGDIIVLWNDNRNGDYDIYSQRIKANGDFFATNLQVNTDPGKTTQLEPDVVFRNGNLYYVWKDYQDAEKGADVYCKIDSWQPGANIRVTSPNGGEVWQANQVQTITWESTEITGDVRIQFSPDGGYPYTLLTWSTENDGEFEWTPEPAQVSDNCVIKISSVENLSINDKSDDPFTIINQTYETIYTANKIPASYPLPTLDGKFDEPYWALARTDSLLYGESWSQPWTDWNDNLVTWKAVWSEVSNQLYVAVTIKDDIRGTFDNNDPSASSYKPWCDESLEFYIDGDHSGGDYDGRYDMAQQWRVSGENNRNLLNYPSASHTDFYTGNDFVTATSINPINGDWTCEAAFKIYDDYPGQLKILQNGDTFGWEIWYADSDDENWAGSFYYFDHFTGWRFMGSASANSDYFGDILLVDNLPIISVISPNGGEVWQVNEKQEIKWEATGITGDVRIQFSPTGGEPYTMLAASIENDGVWEWTPLSSHISENCRIKISSVENSSVYDESDAPFNINLLPKIVSLTIPDTSAAAGSTVKIPVRGDNIDGVAGTVIKVAYDPIILTALKAEKTSLTSAFTLVHSIKEGEMTIFMTNDEGLSRDSGELVMMTFLVSGECVGGDTTGINLQSVTVFDEQTKPFQVTTQTGLFTVEQSIPVKLIVSPASDTLTSGDAQVFQAIGIDKNGKQVVVKPDWLVTDLYGNIGSTFPANGENTTFTASGAGDGLIIAQLPAYSLADSALVVVGNLKGDINIDEAINVQDAILCLQITVDSTLGSPYKCWAGDMNNDGHVASVDALHILDASLENMLPKQNLAAGSGPASVSIGQVIPDADYDFTVPILIHERQDICATDFKIEYDADLYSVESVSPAVSSSMIASKTHEDGLVTIAQVNPDGLVNAQRELVFLKMRRKNKAADIPELFVKEIDIFNRKGEPVTLTAIQLQNSAVEAPNDYALEQNFPNPFNPETQIHYSLPREAQVTLTVYDTQGRTIATLVNRNQPAGTYSVSFDASKLASGLYFYRLDTGGNVSTKKMMLLK